MGARAARGPTQAHYRASLIVRPVPTRLDPFADLRSQWRASEGTGPHYSNSSIHSITQTRLQRERERDAFTKVPVHGLDLRVRLEAVRAQLSTPPTALVPSKGRVVCSEGVAVDPLSRQCGEEG